MSSCLYNYCVGESERIVTLQSSVRRRKSQGRCLEILNRVPTLDIVIRLGVPSVRRRRSQGHFLEILNRVPTLDIVIQFEVCALPWFITVWGFPRQISCLCSSVLCSVCVLFLPRSLHPKLTYEKPVVAGYDHANIFEEVWQMTRAII